MRCIFQIPNKQQNNITELKYNLTKLREAANEACHAALLHKARFENEAVNWADFNCYAAIFSVTDEGLEYFSVKFEEASPNTYKLHQFIREYLSAKGFKDIVVETEW